MIIKEKTFDFLSGNTLCEFDDETAMKYTTAIDRLIEKWGLCEE